MMPQTTPPPVGLCVQDLTVRYGTAAVLQGVSFSVPVSGQLIGLLGVNGSGKTTLLKAAAGLLPHTGQCLLDGVPLESLSTRRLAQTVSYIPQQSGISVSLSAREVVLMGFNPQLGVLQSPTAAMRTAADEALRTVGLANKAGQDYLTLSGGEKQLCILARTIAEDAPLLLLDEPDSALDLANRSRMTALLAQQPDLQGCVFLPGDQPCLTRQTLEALAIGAAPDTIRRPASPDGTPGSPVLFGRDYFAALLHLPEGSGGSAVLRAHPQAIRLLPTPAAELRDIDTRSDLEALRGGKG